MEGYCDTCIYADFHQKEEKSYYYCREIHDNVNENSYCVRYKEKPEEKNCTNCKHSDVAVKVPGYRICNILGCTTVSTGWSCTLHEFDEPLIPPKGKNFIPIDWPEISKEKLKEITNDFLKPLKPNKMKITIDPTAKTISIEDQFTVKMSDLIDELEKLLPGSKWKEYSLQVQVVRFELGAIP